MYLYWNINKPIKTFEISYRWLWSLEKERQLNIHYKKYHYFIIIEETQLWDSIILRNQNKVYQTLKCKYMFDNISNPIK